MREGGRRREKRLSSVVGRRKENGYSASFLEAMKIINLSLLKSSI